MAQKVNVLSAKSDNLNIIPRIYMVKGQNQQNCPLDDQREETYRQRLKDRDRGNKRREEEEKE